MASKIRVRAGELEVEFEGSEDFLRDELPSLLEFLSGLNIAKVSTSDRSDRGDVGGDTTLGTTNTVAAKLGAETGPDLILAAAAKLTFADGVTSFTRKELLAEMQTASNYYKTSFTSNLSTYLSRLVKAGTLLEQAKDTYALSSTKAQELRTALDQ